MSIISQWKVRLQNLVFPSEKVDAIGFAVFNDFLTTNLLTVTEKVQLLRFCDKKNQRFDRFIFNMAGAVGEGGLIITVAQVLDLLTKLMSVETLHLHSLKDIFFFQNDLGESLGHKVAKSNEPNVVENYIAILQTLLEKNLRPATLVALLTLTDKKNKTFVYHLANRYKQFAASEVMTPLIKSLRTHKDVTIEALTLIKDMSKFKNGLAKQLKLSFKENRVDVLLQLLCKDCLAPSMMKTLTSYQAMVAQHIYDLPDDSLKDVAHKSYLLNIAVNQSTLVNAFFSVIKKNVCFSTKKNVLSEMQAYRATWQDRYLVHSIKASVSPNRTIETGCKALSSPGFLKFEVVKEFYQFPGDLKPYQHDS